MPKQKDTWNEFPLFSVAAGQKGDNSMPKENDLEGQQDQGGKHGGQTGMPRPETWPDSRPAQQTEIPGRSRPGQAPGTSSGAGPRK